MPPRRDYSEFFGKKFGKWTVIRDAPDTQYIGREGRIYNRRRFYCVCECGKKQEVRVPDVLNGKSSRCLGCKYVLHGENARKYDLKYRYGQWKVLNVFSDKHTNLYVRCLCDCGNVKDVACHHLRNGRTTMCRACATRLRHKREKHRRYEERI